MIEPNRVIQIDTKNINGRKWIITTVDTDAVGNPCHPKQSMKCVEREPYPSFYIKPPDKEEVLKLSEYERFKLGFWTQDLFPSWETTCWIPWLREQDEESQIFFFQGADACTIKLEDPIEDLVDEFFAEHPKQVEQFIKKPAMIGWFVGQLLKRDKFLDPKKLQAVIKKKISEREI